MNKKSKLIIILILFLGILSYQNETPYEKRTRFLKSYLSETFPEFSLKDGEYLFIVENRQRSNRRFKEPNP
jgi:hypothetical protein